MDQARLRRIARRQHGVFHRDQARDCGFSLRQIRRRLETGAWRRVAGTVLAPAELRVTPELTDRALQLAIPGSVLAGPSAAPYHAIRALRREPCLIVDRRVRRPAMPATLILDQLDRRDVRVVEGVRVTSPGRTVVDCLRMLPYGQALDLLDRALQQRAITVVDLAERVRGWAGRPGAPRLARLVGEVASGTRSAAERRLAGLLRRAEVVGWKANQDIGDSTGLLGVGDIVFPRERLVVEADGLAFHVTPEQFQLDRTRQNRLIAAGWTVLRFTWRDLTLRPAQVVETITRVVAMRSH